MMAKESIDSAGEVAQWLGRLSALPEVLGPVVTWWLKKYLL